MSARCASVRLLNLSARSICPFAASVRLLYMYLSVLLHLSALSICPLTASVRAQHLSCAREQLTNRPALLEQGRARANARIQTLLGTSVGPKIGSMIDPIFGKM